MTIAIGAALIAVPFVWIGWMSVSTFGVKQTVVMFSGALLMTASMVAGVFMIVPK